MARAATFIQNAIRERQRVIGALHLLFPDAPLPDFAVRSRHGYEHLTMLHWAALGDWLKDRVEENGFSAGAGNGESENGEPENGESENGESENGEPVIMDEFNPVEDEQQAFNEYVEDMSSPAYEEPDFNSMNRDQLKEYTEKRSIPVETTGMNNYTTRDDYLRAVGAYRGE